MEGTVYDLGKACSLVRDPESEPTPPHQLVKVHSYNEFLFGDTNHPCLVVSSCSPEFVFFDLFVL